MRICVVYDCLFPYTVGGGERWYRSLVERLASEGHEITYLTLRQWRRGERIDIHERVRVVTAGPRMALYTAGAFVTAFFGWSFVSSALGVFFGSDVVVPCAAAVRAREASAATIAGEMRKPFMSEPLQWVGATTL